MSMMDVYTGDIHVRGDVDSLFNNPKATATERSGAVAYKEGKWADGRFHHIYTN